MHMDRPSGGAWRTLNISEEIKEGELKKQRDQNEMYSGSIGFDCNNEETLLNTQENGNGPALIPNSLQNNIVLTPICLMLLFSWSILSVMKCFDKFFYEAQRISASFPASSAASSPTSARPTRTRDPSGLPNHGPLAAKRRCAAGYGAD